MFFFKAARCRAVQKSVSALFDRNCVEITTNSQTDEVLYIYMYTAYILMCIHLHVYINDALSQFAQVSSYNIIKSR